MIMGEEEGFAHGIKVYIDKFPKRTELATSGDEVTRFCFITHAHQDHLRGLNKFLRDPLYCSVETARAVSIIVPTVSHLLTPLPIDGTDVTLSPDEIEKGEEETGGEAEDRGRTLVVRCLRNSHMAGSFSVYFPREAVMFAGDSRYGLAARKAMGNLIGAGNVPRLLVLDGMFHDPSIKFLSERESAKRFVAFRDRHFTEGRGVVVGIFHAGICDLLRTVGQKFLAEERFLGPKLKAQVDILYPEGVATVDYFKSSPKVWLANPRLFNAIRTAASSMSQPQSPPLDGFTPLLQPSSLWFCCEQHIRKTKIVLYDQKSKCYRLNYSRHADYAENNAIRNFLKVEEGSIKYINALKVKLRCS